MPEEDVPGLEAAEGVARRIRSPGNQSAASRQILRRTRGRTENGAPSTPFPEATTWCGTPSRAATSEQSRECRSIS